MPRGRRPRDAGATQRPAAGKGRYYMISVVARSYGIHPQTLRLYEREGLLRPSRTEGNTRLYSDEDLHELEVVLNLTRDLGVNLAGVEIILNMRRKMEQLQRDVNEFVAHVKEELAKASHEGWREQLEKALVRLPPAQIQVARTRPPGAEAYNAASEAPAHGRSPIPEEEREG
jgi:MerR family transcriptional regulator, heat shock protein HspR